MTRGRSSTLVTHLLMCNKLYNLIFLGDKRMICNRISALMSTHIYINTGCFIGNDHTYRKDLTDGTVRPKGIAHRQSRLIEALISNVSLASNAYLHYLHHLYFLQSLHLNLGESFYGQADHKSWTHPPPALTFSFS